MGAAGPKMPISRSIPEGGAAPGVAARRSASSISSTSPIVMSASTPPLAAMITADRNADWGRGGGSRRVAVAQRPQPREAPGVTRADHVPRVSFRFRPPSSHASDGRMTSAPTRTSGAGHQLQPRRRVCRGAAATGRAAAPLLAGRVGAAGQPPLLPGPAGLLFQPVQQYRQAAPVTAWTAVPAAQHDDAPGTRRGPPGAGQAAATGRAGTGTARPGCRRASDGAAAGRPPVDVTGRLPNSTSSVSGR